MVKKFKEEYTSDELPEPYVTSVDIECNLGLTEEQVFKLLDYLHGRGCGQIFTQIDCEQDETIYSKGVHVVNRTGVYAIVFGR